MHPHDSERKYRALIPFWWDSATIGTTGGVLSLATHGTGASGLRRRPIVCDARIRFAEVSAQLHADTLCKSTWVIWPASTFPGDGV